MRKIDIPKKEPFKNDLLNRKEPAEALTSLVDAIEGPCVLAVDAAWGAGKTTFLGMWAQHLRNQEFPVVCFNAWETDFSDDPFSVLASELTESYFQDYSARNDKTQKTYHIKETIEKLISHATLATGRPVTTGCIDPEESKKTSLNPLLDAHREDKELVEALKILLEGAAKKLSDEKKHPLIVIVDELDRCRPSYVVKFLKITKHLFSVNGIVFVLAVNFSELARSVKSLYGEDFDAQGYLRRFFDDDFQLSQPNRKAFINALISTKHEEWNHVEPLSSMLHGFLGDPELSSRLVAQTIHRLIRVSDSLSDSVSQEEGLSPFLLQEAAILVLRMVNSELYDRFVRGDASDMEVADELFERPGLKGMREKAGGIAFQGFLIAAMRDTSINRNTVSHLEQRIKQNGGPKEGSPEHGILLAASTFSGKRRFQYIRQRVELFAEDPVGAR